MSKVSQKLPTVSAVEMFLLYAKKVLKSNPDYKARVFRDITGGEIYDETTGKVVINYKQYKKIIATFNQKAGEKIIRGFTLRMNNGLGDLLMCRVERPAKSTAINIKASLQLRKQLAAEGKLTTDNWKVPYTDDEFIMLMWHKGSRRYQNIHLYKFKTAGGQPGKGFRNKISNANTSNPLLKALYPYLPSKRPIPYK